MMPDRAWIAAHIPHHGSMCLLDNVEHWDANHIRCHTSSHTDAANPLRAAGRLGIANGIEYAAQAMAIHGALLADSDETPRAGYLTSVREVTWHSSRLDDLAAPLVIDAERLSGSANTILYSFSLQAAGHTVLSGRASVMLDANRS
ncbi:hypothetical protein [Uliginosibacterium gangwonense]|uniref:hypothetical protein n=1 Tax=Uliginosibacterium gangwonense TaxID=392736 RepID=UPI000370A7C0|nr:hypothetical protein [Uliginosibacterium gangwonense]